MRGSPAAADQRLFRMRNRISLEASFQPLIAVKTDQIIMPRDKVEVRAEGPVQIQGLLRKICDLRAAGDDIGLRQNPIVEFHTDAGRRIFKFDDQGFGVFFPGINGGKSLQGIFALLYLIRYVPRITADFSILCLCHQRVRAEVSGSLRRILLRQAVERVGSVHACVRRVRAEAPVPERENVVHRSFCAPAIVQMQKPVMRIRLHLIGAGPCLQSKDSFCAVK